MKIGLLVDSSTTSNISPFHNKKIEVLPLHITGENGFDILDSPENVKKHQLYDQMINGRIFKTSQASPGEVASKYDQLLEKYDHIVHVPIPENLSSMYATAHMVSQQEKYRDRVTVIHNQNLPAQGLRELIIRLESEIANKKLKTPQEVVKAYHQYEPEYYVAIVPSDLKNLARGGRATKVASAVLNAFKTKVLIRWQAHPTKEGISRTVNNLSDIVLKRGRQLHHSKFHLIVTAPLNYNAKTLENLKTILDDQGITYHFEEIPSLYPVHAGVNTIGFIITPHK